jgi:hypothetical protein
VWRSPLETTFQQGNDEDKFVVAARQASKRKENNKQGTHRFRRVEQGCIVAPWSNNRADQIVTTCFAKNAHVFRVVQGRQKVIVANC